MPDISIDRTTYIKIGNSDPLTTGIADGTMLIDRVLFAQDFLFGQFASSMFEIQIYGIDNVAGQKIEVYQKENDIRTDLFVGQIESSKLDNAGYYRDIIAYDKFYFISKKNVADWFNGLWANNTEISVLDAYKSLLAHFDIDYDPNTVTAANFSGTLHKDSVVSFEKISFKDMVKYLLEPLGLIPYINESGKGAVFSPSMANAVDLSGKYDVNQSVFEEYTVNPMQWIGIQNIDSAILQQTEITDNTSDIRYDLPYNPIRLDLYVEDGETARTAVLTNFTNKANFTEYKPCEVFMIVSDMSIKIGDKITTTRGTAYVSEIILSGPMLVEQQLISRGSQVQQEVEEEYDPVFAYLDNRITETADDLQQQLDDFEPSEEYLEKVGEFSDTIAGGMGLQVITYKAQDGSLLKYFYAPPPAGSAVTGISGSDFIFKMGSNGFAWTNKWEGAPDASSESHVDPGTGKTVSTSWTDGISKDGNALLKILNAYKVSADILEGGELVIKDPRGNVIHKFSYEDYSAQMGGPNGISYNASTGKTTIGSDVDILGSVTIGGGATIGDTITNAVDDALTDLDIKGVESQTVEYAISTSGSDIPSDAGTAGHTETLYAVLEQQNDDYLSTISTKSAFEAAYAGFEIVTVAELFSLIYDVGNGSHLYRFTRTDTQNGEYLLGGWTYLGQLTTGNSVMLSATLYCAVSSGSTANASYILDEIDNDTVYAVPLVSLESNGDSCVSFTANLTVGADITISDISTVYNKGSSDTSVIAEIPCYISRTTRLSTNTNTAKTALKNSIDVTSSYVSVKYGYVFSSSYKYFYKFTATIKANGDIVIGDDYELAAEYGVSYPEFSGDTLSNWSSTMPNVAQNKGKYLWTRTVTTYTDGTTSVPVYQATYIGQNGAAGASGTSVTISSIKYAKNQDQSSQPTDNSFNPAMPTLDPGDWLWTKTTYSNGSTAITKTYIGTDGIDGTSVTVSDPTKVGDTTTFTITDKNGTKTVSIKDGTDGIDGVQGEPGADGKTSYVHFAWADSITFDAQGHYAGNTGFDKQDSANKKWIGTYSDFTSSDSSNPEDYSWTLIKGADGQNGTDGKGIYNTVIDYGISANGSSSSGISWQNTLPDTSAAENKGKYFWTRTRIYYTDAPSVVGNTYYSVAYIAENGQNGQNGSPGVGVSNIDQYFFASSSDNASSLPSISPTIDSRWKRLPSELSVKFSATNKYLWSFTQTVYTDSGFINTSPYIIGTWGQDGSGGGSDGRGILSITPQYALSTSNSSPPSENSSLWQNEPAEYPASVSTDKSVVATASASNSMQSILTGISLKKDIAYNVTFAVEGTLSSAATFYLKNSSGTTLVTYARTTSSITATYTPTSNLNNCYVAIYTANQEVDCAASVVVARYYYWQRDEIAWTDNTTSHTEGVLSQGFNAAIYGVNRLNTAFIEAEMGGLTQVFFDAGHIYANSLTAYNVAAYEALIKHLMAHQVDVDGDININSPALDTSGITVSQDDVASELYGKSFSELTTLEQNFVLISVVLRKIELAALEQSKLKVTDNTNWKTVIVPKGLYASNQGETKASHYGYDAEIYGDLVVHGTIYESGSTGLKNLTSYYNGSYCSSDTINFSKKYTNVPEVQLTTQSEYPTFAVVESVSSKDFTYRIYTTLNSTSVTAALNYLVIP